MVGARGEDWGRLIMVRGGPAAPRDLALLERAATTLALGRLLDHQRESLERQAHRTILSALSATATPTRPRPRPGPGRWACRHRAPADGRVVRGQRRSSRQPAEQPGREQPPGGAGSPGLAAQARTAAVADALAAACRQLPVPALVASLDDSRVAALLALPPRADPDTVLSRLAAGLRPRLTPAT